jgi:hypothetical protein
MATKTGTKKVVVMMDRERATKNKQRFEERDRDDKECIGILYADKKNIDEVLGEPDSLKITIEAGD